MIIVIHDLFSGTMLITLPNAGAYILNILKGDIVHGLGLNVIPSRRHGDRRQRHFPYLHPE